MIAPRNILFLLVIVVGGALLQVWLSRRSNRWLGLILPCIAFIYSLLASLGMILYMGEPVGEFVLSCLLVFGLTNIPTIILLGIYFGCREKVKRQADMEKMHIQDLG